MSSYQIGNQLFQVPILNASGCWSAYHSQLNELYSSELGGIVAKTCTIFCKQGNDEPTYYFSEKDGVHFNSKGLPNYGYQYYRELSRDFTDKPYIISIAFEDFDKLKLLLKDYDQFVNKETLVEINLSCPNTQAEIPGYDVEFIEKLLAMLFIYKLSHIKCGLKLPPYFQRKEIHKLADIFNEFSTVLYYIVVSNSIPNCMPLLEGEHVLSTKFGGMSGKINKNIALSNVASFSEKINKNIKIVGCGGIDNVDDILDYFKHGADFVQLASCFYNDHTNKLDIDKINTTIHEFSNKKNI